MLHLPVIILQYADPPVVLREEIAHGMPEPLSGYRCLEQHCKYERKQDTEYVNLHHQTYCKHALFCAIFNPSQKKLAKVGSKFRSYNMKTRTT